MTLTFLSRSDWRGKSRVASLFLLHSKRPALLSYNKHRDIHAVYGCTYQAEMYLTNIDLYEPLNLVHAFSLLTIEPVACNLGLPTSHPQREITILKCLLY